MVISFRRPFSNEPQTTIYFRGDGIYCREGSSDEREVIIDCLKDIADEGRVASEKAEGASDGNRVFICEAEDAADAREDTSDEPEEVLDGVKAVMELTALRFRSICALL